MTANFQIPVRLISFNYPHSCTDPCHDFDQGEFVSPYNAVKGRMFICLQQIDFEQIYISEQVHYDGWLPRLLVCKSLSELRIDWETNDST